MSHKKLSSAISRIGHFFSRPFTDKNHDPSHTIEVFNEYELFKRFEARWVRKRSQLIKTQMLSYFFMLESAPDKLN
jgi:hypothetical protein